MQTDRLFTTFLELVQIPSPTFHERQVADYLIDKLQSLGLLVIEDDSGSAVGSECGNIIATLKGSCPHAPRLFFCSHMDTVLFNGTIRAVFDGTRFTSNGTTILGADDKAGIAPLLEAIRTIKEERLEHGDLQFIFTTAEEGGLLGAKHLNPKLLQADFGYCLDSSGDTGRLILAAPGENELQISIYGRCAHAGIAPETGINAILAAARAISTLPQGRIDAETTVNIGVISGGTVSNIVPDKATVICEARSLNSNKLATQTQNIIQHFTHHCANLGASCSIKTEHCFKPYQLNESDSVVQTALHAFKACNLQPQLTASGGGSDANFFNRHLPCAVLGIGIRRAHTKHEYIEAADLVATTQIVLAIIAHIASHQRCQQPE